MGVMLLCIENLNTSFLLTLFVSLCFGDSTMATPFGSEQLGFLFWVLGEK